MDFPLFLKKLNFSDKEVAVYEALLSLGPSSVRELASKTNINRGTTYDILRSLMERGVVSYYHEATKQKFAAEDPERMLYILKREEERVKLLEDEFKELLPELRSRAGRNKERPVTRFYEGSTGIRTILEDVLSASSEEKNKKEYYVFSSLDVRKHLYKSFKDFTKQRIAKNISIKVISIGMGWEDELMASMLAERKWLSKKEGAPTFIIIYAGKVAFISLNRNKVLEGTVVEDEHLFETQKKIFLHLWETL